MFILVSSLLFNSCCSSTTRPGRKETRWDMTYTYLQLRLQQQKEKSLVMMPHIQLPDLGLIVWRQQHFLDKPVKLELTT